jgi:hypothetical protein
MDIALPSFGQKLKLGIFSNKETKGIFWIEIKKNYKYKKLALFFYLTRPTMAKNSKLCFEGLKYNLKA